MKKTNHATSKLFIDTNILLELYQFPKVKDLLDWLMANTDSLVFTSLSRNEFYRNRSKYTNQLLNGFAPSPKTNELPDVISRMEGITEYRKIAQKANKKLREIEKKIISSFEDPADDPIAKIFESLYTRATNITITDQIADASIRRKTLGKPPKSEKKNTSCDEAHWEALLTLRHNLIIVTKDGGFTGYAEMLREEFKFVTGFELLGITSHLKEAIKLLGSQPPATLIEAEKENDATLPTLFFGRIPNAQFIPIANSAADLSLAGSTTYIGATFVECNNCHQPYRSNLLQCPNCGRPNEIW